MTSAGLMGLVLTLAFVGYLAAARRGWPLDPAFLPAIILSGFGLVVLGGGLLGVMPWTARGAVVIGLGLLVWELIRHPREVLAVVRDPAVLVLGLLTVVLTLMLHDQELHHYDDFSHWGLVVRVMLGGDALPTAGDAVVTFQSYPVGSGAFVYGVSSLLGGQEWQMMLAQGVLLAGYLVSLLAFGRTRPWLAALAVAGTLAAFAAYLIPLSSLLVDGLLAAQVGCIVLLVVHHRRDLARLWVPWGILMSFLAVTKTSGLFFVLALTVLGAVLLRSAGGRLGWRFWAAAASPWAWTLLWRAHVGRTFESGMDTKHSLSWSRLTAALAEKTPAERGEIVSAYLTRATGDLLMLGLVVLGLLLLLGLVHHGVLTRRQATGTALGVGAVFVVYHLANLGMYLTSMPTGEALALAGYRRYLGTLHLVLLVPIVAGLLVLASRAVRRSWSLAGAAALVVTLGLVVLVAGDPASLRPAQSETRSLASAALAESSVSPGDAVCVVLDEPDAGYTRYVVRYLILSAGVTEHLVSPTSPDPDFGACAHIVLLRPNDRARELLLAQGLDADHPLPHVVSR